MGGLARLTLFQWKLLTMTGWATLPLDIAGLFKRAAIYDLTGNREVTVNTADNSRVTMVYDAANRLQTSTDDTGTTTYTYDNNGNQWTVEEPGGDITTNTWDGENRLIQVAHPDSSIVAYYYNGDGLKVVEDDGVEQTLYVYDGNNLLQEQSVYGTVAEFTYVPAPYAQALSQKREGDSSFFHGDGMSNVTGLTDSWQIITDEYTYDAWGKLRNAYGTTANSQLFKGEHLAYRQDPNAGPDALFALHHRHYASEIGRFTSEDPAADDLHLYRYVGNNPVNAADPSGCEEEEFLKVPVPRPEHQMLQKTSNHDSYHFRREKRRSPQLYYYVPTGALPTKELAALRKSYGLESDEKWEEYQSAIRPEVTAHAAKAREFVQERREAEQERLKEENTKLRQEELRLGRLKGGMEATLGGLQIAGAGIAAFSAAPVSVPAVALAYGLAGAEALRGADVGIAGIRNASNPDTEHKTLTNQGITAATGSQEAGDLGETIVDVTLAGANIVPSLLKGGVSAGRKLSGALDESANELADDLVKNTPNVKNAPEVKPTESVPSAKVDALGSELLAARQRIAGQVEEVARRRSLGTSSAGYNAAEEAAAIELENQLGKQLSRDPSNAADWMIGKTTYDHWTTNPVYFEEQLKNGNLLKSLKKHVTGIKSDFAVVDSLGLSDMQLESLKKLVASLSPAERSRIIDLRGNLGLK